ncbi:SufE family protein [Lysinimonas soli]|uniref:SufE family protein n=1 Tax=Lysinimonas soli TaxID=1074233 RepID=A0ABW0NR07_9MICO
MTSAALPEELAAIRDDFLSLEKPERLQLLLEFSQQLPELPARYADHPDLLERVVECQSPVFLFVEVDEKRIVHVFMTAPKESPTTRGFASILAQGLAGLTVEQVLAVPSDFPFELGLTEAVSPLRLRGMVGMLGRIQRQVKDKAA